MGGDRYGFYFAVAVDVPQGNSVYEVLETGTFPKPRLGFLGCAAHDTECLDIFTLFVGDETVILKEFFRMGMHAGFFRDFRLGSRRGCCGSGCFGGG